jgi:dTMP kinase
MPKGLFIALEGIDGAGTTTQSRLLAGWLEGRGRPVVLTAEPTRGPVGAIIHQILQRKFTRREAGEPATVDEETLALLFAADRSDHLHNTILPALETGSVVVSDRHYLSSVAYQSLGVEMAWVEALNSRFRRPELTIVLELAPEASLGRKHAQGLPTERYEQIELLGRVAENYGEAIRHAQAAGESIISLDGAQPIHAIHEQIRELVAPLLEPPREGDAT